MGIVIVGGCKRCVVCCVGDLIGVDGLSSVVGVSGVVGLDLGCCRNL